jgi:hypothetical protein
MDVREGQRLVEEPGSASWMEGRDWQRLEGRQEQGKE